MRSQIRLIIPKKTEYPEPLGRVLKPGDPP